MSDFDLETVAERLRTTDQVVARRNARARHLEERDRYCETDDEAVAFDRGVELGELFAATVATRQALAEASRIRETGHGVHSAATLREELSRFLRRGIDANRFDMYGWPSTMWFNGWPDDRIFSDRDNRSDPFLFGVNHACAELFDAVRNLGEE